MILYKSIGFGKKLMRLSCAILIQCQESLANYRKFSYNNLSGFVAVNCFFCMPVISGQIGDGYV